MKNKKINSKFQMIITFAAAGYTIFNGWSFAKYYTVLE